MAKMGRPKTDDPRSERVHIRLTRGEWLILDRYAQKHKMTIAEVARTALNEYLSNQDMTVLDE